MFNFLNNTGDEVLNLGGGVVLHSSTHFSSSLDGEGLGNNNCNSGVCFVCCRACTCSNGHSLTCVCTVETGDSGISAFNAFSSFFTCSYGELKRTTVDGDCIITAKSYVFHILGGSAFALNRLTGLNNNVSTVLNVCSGYVDTVVERATCTECGACAGYNVDLTTVNSDVSSLETCKVSNLSSIVSITCIYVDVTALDNDISCLDTLYLSACCFSSILANDNIESTIALDCKSTCALDTDISTCDSAYSAVNENDGCIADELNCTVESETAESKSSGFLIPSVAVSFATHRGNVCAELGITVDDNHTVSGVDSVNYLRAVFSCGINLDSLVTVDCCDLQCIIDAIGVSYVCEIHVTFSSSIVEKVETTPLNSVCAVFSSNNLFRLESCEIKNCNVPSLISYECNLNVSCTAVVVIVYGVSPKLCACHMIGSVLDDHVLTGNGSVALEEHCKAVTKVCITYNVNVRTVFCYSNICIVLNCCVCSSGDLIRNCSCIEEDVVNVGSAGSSCTCGGVVSIYLVGSSAKVDGLVSKALNSLKNTHRIAGNANKSEIHRRISGHAISKVDSPIVHNNFACIVGKELIVLAECGHVINCDVPFAIGIEGHASLNLVATVCRSAVNVTAEACSGGEGRVVESVLHNNILTGSGVAGYSKDPAVGGAGTGKVNVRTVLGNLLFANACRTSGSKLLGKSQVTANVIESGSS